MAILLFDSGRHPEEGVTGHSKKTRLTLNLERSPETQMTLEYIYKQSLQKAEGNARMTGYGGVDLRHRASDRRRIHSRVVHSIEDSIYSYFFTRLL